LSYVHIPLPQNPAVHHAHWAAGWYQLCCTIRVRTNKVLSYSSNNTICM